MTGSISGQPLTVAHGQEDDWYPRSIAITFNNDMVLAIKPSHIVSVYFEPKGTKVSDDEKLEAVAMQMTANFWVPGKNFDIGAVEILDLLKPEMMDISNIIQTMETRTIDPDEGEVESS